MATVAELTPVTISIHNLGKIKGLKSPAIIKDREQRQINQNIRDGLVPLLGQSNDKDLAAVTRGDLVKLVLAIRDKKGGLLPTAASVGSNWSRSGGILSTKKSGDSVGVATTKNKSLFEVDGAVGLAIEVVTAATKTLDKTHSTILGDATAASQVFTLPTRASAYNANDKIGRIYNVKKIDSTVNTVTLKGNGTENIDGSNTQVHSVQYNNFTVQAGSQEWHII